VYNDVGVNKKLSSPNVLNLNFWFMQMAVSSWFGDNGVNQVTPNTSMYFNRFLKGLRMLNEEWIKTQIAEARKSNPNVTDTVVEHIKELFNSQLTEQQLTSAELKNLSIILLQEMGLHSLEKGGKQ
jgi:hypothetical protein